MIFYFLKMINRFLTGFFIIIDINLPENILKENETEWKNCGLFIFQRLFIFQPFILF